MNKIAILGTGAIGQLIHYQLNQSIKKTDSLCFIDRQKTRCHKVNVTTLLGDILKYDANFINAQSPQSAFTDIQLLIVCVKSYQVIDALVPLINQLPPRCHILLLHNGMGPHLILQEKLHASYPTIGLSLGTTSQGALRHTAWHIEQTGTGLTQFGHHSGPLMVESLKARLLNSIDNAQYCESILPMLWQKLAVNAVINPLTAIERCKNGALSAERFRLQIDTIAQEIILVAQHDAILLNKAALIQRILDVISLTKNNFSSMYQDITHHRRSEIDNINGYIIQRAEKHRLSVPENILLYHKVKDLESI
ncbi:ketopantoate reductase family protein [Shewanella surugensis]|uniref:2-dehydropantoate 2-reductase n=1 Tax=Shewanella surugensis TaxID=212020 RepID=A0ABT0LD98_9GAMM|nr:2-dehydropantoate 2-reductase [Shewanella surugensis]MCL1125307.1 2-dehydropantoate 2-reductase [Shewanella surugensis]